MIFITKIKTKDMTQNNVCKRCGNEKAPDQFYYNQQGYRSSPYCKPCKAEVTDEKKQKKRFNEAGEELFVFGDGDQIYDYQKMWA